MTPEIPSSDIYTDFSRFENLRGLAREKSDEAIREVAGQFESLFLQMMLKGMRDAAPSMGLMENDQTRFYRDMHDKQLSLHLSKQSNLGLADMIAKQLGGTVEPTDPPEAFKQLNWYRTNAINPSRNPETIQKISHPESAPVTSGNKEVKNLDTRPINSPEDFIRRLYPYAQEAAGEIGVDPKMLLAQAALETGWGKSVIHHADGSNSHNLFGIKADSRWRGDRASVPTLEYSNGVAEKRRANFRSYDGFRESFQDYVQFLKSNGRYQKALENADNPHAFIRSLQNAGYATDPNYAKKVISIFERGDINES